MIETIGYAQRLEGLFDGVNDSCLPVIRVYFEKLRKTTGQSLETLTETGNFGDRENSFGAGSRC